MKLRHRPSSAPLTPLADDEELNVRIITVPPQTSSELAEGDVYLVRDGDGLVYPTGAHHRRAALRELGGFVLRGAPAPLILLAPDGTPTGDRLA